MQNHFSVFTFISVVVAVGCFQKLASRMFRRTSVSWKHCFTFGLFIAMLKLANHFTGDWMGTELGYAISVSLGLLMTAVIGGWFFRYRATTAEGEALGWSGGIQFAGLAFGLMLLASLAVGALRLLLGK